jgi:arsenical-resistance protein 2
MAEAPKSAGSWTDAFPAPRTTAPILPRADALSALASPDLLIVDVRRTDYEGGAIQGSINLPAHSFYMNRGVLLDLCKRAGVKKVAFYCGRWLLYTFRVDCLAMSSSSRLQSRYMNDNVFDELTYQ